MLRTVFLFLLVVWTLWLATYHLGVLRPPEISPNAKSSAEFIDKEKMGIHQMILTGDAYGRGLRAGELEKRLLRKEEDELTSHLFRLLPKTLFIAAEVPLIWAFHDAEQYLQPWMLQEMYGISRSAPKEYDFLIDGYTRQLAYHGLHEVGQMMVDQRGDDEGCTVVAAPFHGDWVLGRNFDFEGGRILDREKIMKWVFPTEGYAYVSVIWAGMVGGVTAVNENGIYLSINAAGSHDRRRIGVPSSLLLIETMRRAKTAAEALEILRSSPMFITDIFVLLDAKSGELYRIEKSPLHTEVIPVHGPTVITNHLISPYFKDDPINEFRRTQLTSQERLDRGELLVKQLPKVDDIQDLELPVLEILRDKAELPPGNRRAIDSLIATHSIVFNSKQRILFVSQGPAISGKFIGFDLNRSFQERRPVLARELPRDSNVSDELFGEIESSMAILQSAESLISHGDCDRARVELEKVTYHKHYAYEMAEGDFDMICGKNSTAAKGHWHAASDLKPAYARERDRLHQRLAE